MMPRRNEKITSLKFSFPSGELEVSSVERRAQFCADVFE